MSAHDPNTGHTNPPAESLDERRETVGLPAAPDHPAIPSRADPAATRTGADPAATLSGISAPAFADAPPVSTGRYELGEEIARGGMGVIYRATDTAFGREVAVKVLLDKFSVSSGAARRFADEARITGQLQHPAIPRLTIWAHFLMGARFWR